MKLPIAFYSFVLCASLFSPAQSQPLDSVASTAASAGMSSPPPPERRTLRKDFISGAGTKLYLGLGTALPLLEDGGKLGRSRTVRTVAALGATAALTEGLKLLTREKRPDGTDRMSFPSGHASAAFALATMRAQFRPRQAPYWYAGAMLISASRVRLKRHHVHDVIAGALLGHVTARYVLNHWHDPQSAQAQAPLQSPGLTFQRRF